MPTLRLITTCSDTKSAPVPGRHRLRSHGGGRRTRFESWIDALSESDFRVPARDLYQGDHWSVSAGLAGERGAWQVELWVASAGYGLVRIDDPLAPYAATFTAGHADSVPTTSREQSSLWWHQLATWQGPTGDPHTPRTVEALAQRDHLSPILVVASAPYLDAMGADILRARDVLLEPDTINIVSAGNSIPALQGLALPTDARLCHTLGGSRISLNARTARWLVEGAGTHGFHREEMIGELERLLAAQPELQQYDRQPLTDNAVRAFIRKALQTSEARTSKTRLLRELRERGHACEQKRFGALYVEVVDDEQEAVAS